MRILLTLCCLVLGPMAAQADDVDIAAANGCLNTAISNGANPAQCILDSQTQCDAYGNDAPAAAIVCFKKAQDTWAQAIAARIAAIETLDPNIAPLARVEVKYALLSAMLQCDRTQELGTLTGTPGQTVLALHAQCTARATGLSYAQLMQQSHRVGSDP